MKYSGFVGPWYRVDAPNVDAQRTINLYPEAVVSGTGKNDLYLQGTPGLVTFATLANTPVRALWAGGAPLSGAARLFAAGGNTLYEVTSGAVISTVGTIGNDAANTPVQVFSDGNNLLVISAGQSYQKTSGSLTNLQADSSAMPLARTGAYLDGHFIIAAPNSRDIFVSGINDPSTWDPLDFAVKEGYPDKVGAILGSHSDLWIFGESTTEVWRNTGNPDFPFGRDPGAFIHQGIVAPWSACRLMNGVAWIGADQRGGPVCWFAQGFTPKRISTHAIEEELGQFGNNGATPSLYYTTAYTYVDNGHHFWVLNIQDGGGSPHSTWCYDASMDMWHQRAWYDGSSFIAQQRQRCHAYAFGKHFVGDRSNGKIYEMSTDRWTDDGTAIHRIRTGPHISDEEKLVAHHKFTLDAETGLGGTNPNVWLSWSDDGGHTWSAEKAGYLGATSAFKTRVIWRRLGASRDRIYSIRVSADAPITLIDAWLELQVGSH
jgi:hypothetical protein